MIKKGFLISLIFVFSTVIQLISQIVVTRLFGASFELDVFLAAVALPTIIVTVIYGTLNDVLLPYLGEIKNSRPAELNKVFVSILFYFTLFISLISFLLYLFSYPLAELLYRSRGEIFLKAVATQLSLMSLSYPLSAIATIFGTFFYLHKNTLRFPLAQMIGSIANVVLILLLINKIGIWSLVIAFILNILIQIFFVLPPAYLLNFSNYKFIHNYKFLILNLLSNWFPLLFGYFALKNDTLLVRSFGSSLPEGSLVQLNLIYRIFSLATSVMTIGFQIVLLPQLVEDFDKKNYDKAKKDVRNFKFITLGISIVITLITVILTPYLIRLLFVGGKFSELDAANTLSFIPIFIIPAVGWGINNIYFQPLIALKKQKILGAINIFAFILAWLVGSIINKNLGAGHAISSSLLTLIFTGIIGSEILWQYYKKRLFPK